MTEDTEIETVIKIGSVEVPVFFGMSDGISPASEKLKDATVLKDSLRYDEACAKLREAYVAEGAGNLMTKAFLRLPMYLLLAGKNDEGWNELCRLFRTRKEEHFAIVNQMRVFCSKEKNASRHEEYLKYLAWSEAKSIARLAKKRIAE